MLLLLVVVRKDGFFFYLARVIVCNRSYLSSSSKMSMGTNTDQTENSLEWCALGCGVRIDTQLLMEFHLQSVRSLERGDGLNVIL